MRILTVVGARPQFIKAAAFSRVVRERHTEILVHTGQHYDAGMSDVFFEELDIPRPQYHLGVGSGSHGAQTGRMLEKIEQVMVSERPDVVLVYGDTNSTLAGALAASKLHVPVAHVEAGLRTGDKARPFPEEINRRLTSSLADWHFAPTRRARQNLLAEHVHPDHIFVTGNTAVDALLTTVQRIESGAIEARIPPVAEEHIHGRRLLLVTGHRRESFGAGFERICQALRTIAERHPDVAIVYPVHLNPNVQEPVRRLLGDVPRILLLPPLDYVPFVALMRRAEIILTDSGGIQEEAPSLGRPVLVLRDTTERPEGVEAGAARLVGTKVQRIVGCVAELLADSQAYAAMAGHPNPYGDGNAAQRIADLVLQILAGTPPSPAS